MKAQSPSAFAGEVCVTLGDAKRTFRFGMNTLRDYTALTGTPAGGFAADLNADYNTALLNLVYCGVKRYVPATALPEDFSLDVLGDWMDGLSPEDSNTLAEAIMQALNPTKGGNPLMAALLHKLTPPTAEPTATGGGKSLTSASAN